MAQLSGASSAHAAPRRRQRGVPLMLACTGALLLAVAVAVVTRAGVAEATPNHVGDSRRRGRRNASALAEAVARIVSDSATPADVATMYGVRTADSLQRFEAWFSQHGGGWNRKVKLDMVDAADGAMLRVVAVEALDAESEVVRVPERLLLHGGMLQGSVPRSFTDHQRLSLALLDELALGSQSKWHPYIQCLPSRLASPLHFTAADMEALSGAYAGVIAQHMLQQYMRFEATAVAWAREQRPALASTVFTPKLLRWATSMVQSRAFTIDKPKDPDHPLNGRPFLAPGADLLNHSPAARVGWSLGARNKAAASVGGAFQIYTLLSAQRGDEVYNHYQDFGGAHLLSHYGFSVSDNANDFLPISLGLPVKDVGTPLGQYKQQLLKKFGLRQVQKLRPSGVSTRMINVVRVLALAEERERWVADDFDTSSQLLPVTSGEEETARHLLADALTNLLHGLPAEDSFGEAVSDLARPVISAVVAEERKLLQRSLRWLMDDGALGVVEGGATQPAGSLPNAESRSEL